MTLPTRHLLIGLLLGATCATALSAMGPNFVLPALGDEMAAGFDTAGLVHVDHNDYTTDYDSTVSTEPLTRTRIKKIEYGRVSYVDITTTSSGTYSSDAMFSPHVKYPGVHVGRTKHGQYGSVSIWDGKSQWINLPLTFASSIITLPAGTNRVYSGGGTSCIVSAISTVC